MIDLPMFSFVSFLDIIHKENQLSLIYRETTLHSLNSVQIESTYNKK